MKLRTPLRAASAGALMLALGVALSTGAGASTPRTFEWQQTHSALFVETDASAGNSVLSYQRSSDGTISFAGSFSTGGVGATAANATADPLASQDGLVLANNGADLLATNPGSNTVSVFAVDGTNLRLIQQVPSGGLFPDSIADSWPLPTRVAPVPWQSSSGLTTNYSPWPDRYGVSDSSTPPHLTFTTEWAKSATRPTVST
jgi:hypothetical protein